VGSIRRTCGVVCIPHLRERPELLNAKAHPGPHQHNKRLERSLASDLHQLRTSHTPQSTTTKVSQKTQQEKETWTRDESPAPQTA